jgi:hypothetical protein
VGVTCRKWRRRTARRRRGRGLIRRGGEIGAPAKYLTRSSPGPGPRFVHSEAALPSSAERMN